MTDMQVPNFDGFQFRCSSLGKIMTGIKWGLSEAQKVRFDELDRRYRGLGKPLTPNMMEEHADLLSKKVARPKLSATTQTYLQEIFLEAVFGRVKEVQVREMVKGNLHEERSISLYSDVMNVPYFKNKESRSNDYIKGTCDNVTDIIRDVKTSWDIYTFPFYDETLPSSDYWWQVHGYMWLWDKKAAEVIYCLVDTPEMQITDEKFKYARQHPDVDISPEIEEQIEKNLLFEHDIPANVRVRVFGVEYDEQAIEALKVQIDKCREYLNQLAEDLRNRLAV